MSLLEVNDLHVVYERRREPDVHAVRGVSFEIEEDQTFGLVGESGCGKTTVIRAILQALPENGRITGGEIIYDGRDLTEMSRREIDRVRWKDIAMIPQSAMASLTPVYTVGRQIREAIQTHEDGVSNREARERARELMQLVGIEQDRVDSYPHELSGGMKQRAIIAMSLALNPRLLIADEPTTALDVIVQGQVLYRISELQRELGNSMLMITHDISVVAETCDRIAVMYGGEFLEEGTTDQILDEAYHPYTLGLQNSFPQLNDDRELISIPGAPPDLSDPPSGCPFVPRCPFAEEVCGEPLPTVEQGDGHLVRCHEPTPYAEMREAAPQRRIWQRVVEP